MRLRELAALAAGAALLSGCGSPPSPSLIQLRSQGSRICASAGRRFGRIGTPRTEAGGEAFLNHGIAVLGPELGQLRKLNAPSEVADVYQAAIEALGDELLALRGAVRGLKRDQDPVIAFKTLQRHLGPLETQADDAWQALQMPACVEG